ncbi:hypothetical protein PVAG01_00531 [Phlyctema vagabunda]|uniref:Uncharacterized protein n=1 Tax=Phlyctema vagabunda TaxID=108571 RepID=A0ABR4PUH0_9HELO
MNNGEATEKPKGHRVHYSRYDLRGRTRDDESPPRICGFVDHVIHARHNNIYLCSSRQRALGRALLLFRLTWAQPGPGSGRGKENETRDTSQFDSTDGLGPRGVYSSRYLDSWDRSSISPLFFRLVSFFVEAVVVVVVVGPKSRNGRVTSTLDLLPFPLYGFPKRVSLIDDLAN